MRKLKPCGTQAAYLRHIKRKEKPCEPCVLANRAAKAEYAATYDRRAKGEGKAARPMQPTTVHTTAADKALAERPPVIVWEKNSRGIFVAVSVQDPHADSVGHQELMDRIDRREAQEAKRLQVMREEARRVAARFEQARRDTTPLMTAARTEI